jgi:hypothetical protein
VYDPRIGRFLSVDPLQRKFADLTPYQFAGNTPIQAVDLDGKEPQGFMAYWEARTNPYMTKYGYTVQDFYDYETKKVWTVMNYPNTNDYYYWATKYENAHNLFKPYNTSLNKTSAGQWTGLFKEFRPKKISDDRSLQYGALAFLATPFVAMGLIEVGVASLAAIEGQVANLLLRGIISYYRYAPAIGAGGRTIAELLDETGSIGAQNAVYRSLAVAATKNANATKVLLGKYVANSAESYNVRAGSEYTFFNLDNWNEVLKSFGNDLTKMWEINKQFLKNQIDAGKDVFLSHDPSKATGYFLEEVNYLKEEGFKTFKQVGENLWQAVKE